MINYGKRSTFKDSAESDFNLCEPSIICSQKYRELIELKESACVVKVIFFHHKIGKNEIHRLKLL